MRTSFVLRMLLVLVCVAMSAAAVPAQQNAAQTTVPRLVQFSGVLKDAATRPVAGVSSVTFAIYAEQEGGAALWSETQNVLADANGHYSIVLGAATSGGFPVELFGTGQSRWLGVTIARHEESPRILMASVPYALKAGDAETLGGLPASSYVTTQQLEALNARPATTFVNGGGSTIVGAPATASVAGSEAGASTDAAQSVIQANPTGSGTTDYIPLWTSGSNLGNSLLFQTGGKLGVGTTTPASTLDINGGEILRGGFYEYPQGTATASTGQPSHSFQWDASTFNSSTKVADNYAFGFRAMPQSNNTATPAASLDLFYGTGGPTGSLTDTGLSINNKGVITFAANQQFNGTQASFDHISLTPDAMFPDPTITLNGSSFLGVGLGSDTFLGLSAGPATFFSGSMQNVGIGLLALHNNQGSNNVAVGSGALKANTDGRQNTAVGDEALIADTDGYENTAVGASALATVTVGGGNTSIGYEALSGDVEGSYNTAVGYQAGLLSTGDIGNENTMIGVNAAVAAGVSGSTAIGYGATATVDDVLVLGGSTAQQVNVGIGTSAPISQLDIEANTQATLMLPVPQITLTNNLGGVDATVSLDFNTYAPTPTHYNPSARMALVDQGNYGDSFVFFTNKPGAANNGLLQLMSLDTAGNLRVGGSISKAGGSFKIDDPVDPAGKYLSHSFVESPDMKNIYDGIVTLDAHGSAVITMPDWFDALNRDFRYQLTAVGAPAPKLYVAEKMHGNQFRIAGGKKGQEISWMVTGIRQDAWANAHRIPTEEAKPPSEQGHYLHPELFGATPDRAIAASSHLSAAARDKAVVDAGVQSSTPLNGGH